MDDLTRIEADLELKRQSQTQAREELEELSRAAQDKLSSVHARLKVFQSSVVRRVPVHISRPQPGTMPIGPSLVVSLGSSTPWICRPDYCFRITAGATSFGIRSEDSATVYSQYNQSEDGIIVSLSEFAGKVIKHGAAGCRPPAWLVKTYYGLSVIFGLIAFVWTWIVIGDGNGIWGLLLGWIPALVVAYLAGILWPLAAGILLLVMLR